MSAGVAAAKRVSFLDLINEVADDWDLLDAIAADDRRAVPVPGSAAALLVLLDLLPTDSEAERRMDEKGILGTRRAELYRSRLLTTLGLLRATAAPQLGGETDETEGVSPTGYSEEMTETMTLNEAAEYLDKTPQWIGKLLDRGDLTSRMEGGKRVATRASVEAMADRRS